MRLVVLNLGNLHQSLKTFSVLIVYSKSILQNNSYNISVVTLCHVIMLLTSPSNNYYSARVMLNPVDLAFTLDMP